MVFFFWNLPFLKKLLTKSDREKINKDYDFNKSVRKKEYEKMKSKDMTKILFKIDGTKFIL